MSKAFAHLLHGAASRLRSLDALPLWAWMYHCASEKETLSSASVLPPSLSAPGVLLQIVPCFVTPDLEQLCHTGWGAIVVRMSLAVMGCVVLLCVSEPEPPPPPWRAW